MTRGEDNKDVRHFVQHLKNVYLEMLKSLCLHLLTLLRYFLELNKERRIYNFLFFWINVIAR